MSTFMIRPGREGAGWLSTARKRAARPLRERVGRLFEWLPLLVAVALFSWILSGCANVVRGTHLYVEQHSMDYDLRSGQRGLDGEGYTLGVSFDLAALLPPEPRPVYSVPPPAPEPPKAHRLPEGDPRCLDCCKTQAECVGSPVCLGDGAPK